MPSTAYSHLQTVAITVSLGALPASVAGFGGVLLVDSLANSSLTGYGGSTLAVGSNGSLFVETDVASATSANNDTVGSVGTQALADLTGGLSHATAPETVGLLAVDLAGGDTLESIWTDVDDALGASFDFYGVVPVSRSLADIALTMTGVNTAISNGRERVVISQSSDAASLGDTATWEAADVGALAPNIRERIFQCYHDVDAQPMAAAVATRGLSRSPDRRSSPWNFDVPNITKLWASGPPSGGIAQAKSRLTANRINYALPLAGASYWLEPGHGSGGSYTTGGPRPFYVVVTADWFKARLQERIATWKVQYGDAGIKIPISFIGQNQILDELEALYQIGVLTDHFLSREEAEAQGIDVVIRALPITDEDRTKEQLRFECQLPAKLNARVIMINVTITQ